MGEDMSERGDAGDEDSKPVPVEEAEAEVSTDELEDAEYVDEGKYTTVTVEPMDASREGLRRLEDDQKDTDPDGANHVVDNNSDTVRGSSRRNQKKQASKDHSVTRKKRRNFRYENKAERKLARVKTKVKNMKQAKARKKE